MDVVVTGASGHVGAALLRALVARGDRVVALVHRDARALEGLEVEPRRADVRDEGAVREALRGAEVVYHAAAKLSLEAERDPETEATNVEGTRNVIAACRAHGVRRLVHFSSAHALRRDGSALLAPGEGLPYERSKALAEREVLEAVERGLDAVIVSPCAVVGPFDFKPSYIGRVLLMLAKGMIPATVRGGQSWVDVRDIAASAIAAGERGAAGSRFVLSGHWHTMQDFARMASGVAEARPPLGAVPPWLAKAFAPMASAATRAVGREPLFTRASIDALEPSPRPLDPGARETLGHAPRPLVETLTDAYAFFEAQGWIQRRRR